MANKKRKCKQCKEYKPTNGGFIAPVGFLCGDECRKDFVKLTQEKQRDKAFKQVVKAKKDKNKAFDKKVRGNDKQYQIGLTQPVFNELVRLQEFKWFADRGLEPECISCGKKNMDWCAGHFKTVGSQGALRFDFVNVNLQCNKYCNQALSGNINGNKTTRGYLQGLHDRFGEVVANEIITYCEKDRIAEWDCEELIKMRKRFRAEIRELKAIL